ncbi:hypothetical protein CEXT_114711 [Caerostris extrusa]|uniref:Uncharacterized protein n=1 Tax=Caerostris extrusa TaxID=172846 RepID=A0AAV4X6R9_CAEEX|nr:hypothetical protein CEXT_114711 [Caerostris extrusa]
MPWNPGGGCHHVLRHVSKKTIKIYITGLTKSRVILTIEWISSWALGAPNAVSQSTPFDFSPPFYPSMPNKISFVSVIREMFKVSTREGKREKSLKELLPYSFKPLNQFQFKKNARCFKNLGGLVANWLAPGLSVGG